MSRHVELRIEKELYEELFKNFNKLEERIREQEQRDKCREPILETRQIGEREYIIYNTKTKRAHDVELGLDWVF